MVVSDHYLKTYSHNPIQTGCVQLLGEFSELIEKNSLLGHIGQIFAL